MEALVGVLTGNVGATLAPCDGANEGCWSAETLASVEGSGIAAELTTLVSFTGRSGTAGGCGMTATSENAVLVCN